MGWNHDPVACRPRIWSNHLKIMHGLAPHIWLPHYSESVSSLCPNWQAGNMVAYDDDNWLEILKGLDLTPDDKAAAKLFLFEKNAAYRQMMLGDDNESNKKVILLALGESLLCMGCMGMCRGKAGIQVPYAA